MSLKVLVLLVLFVTYGDLNDDSEDAEGTFNPRNLKVKIVYLNLYFLNF